MTMQNPIPLDLTQANLGGLMEAGQAIANIPGATGGSSPLGGIGDMLNTVERVLNLANQFNDSFDRFGMTIAKFKGMDMPGLQQDQGGFFPQGQVIDGDIYRPPSTVTADITEPKPRPTEPDQEPTTVEPIKVYSKALGWLAQLPEDMTMKEALELARTNKGMILGAIEKELPDLLGNPDGLSE
jgi:hypothetical protein|tara:strand:- start:980 stop:1531 length:552 start_codon:yes stop_codon:yes gene_type:complete